MSSIDKYLFWVFQDEDINNEELFFPPDTPIGSINLTKSKSKLKKRHERQLKRLTEQQLQELCRFQKKFSERYDHQVYLNPPPPACEFINGMDFLREFGADLANLANVQADSSQVRQNNSEKVGDDKRRRNSKNMIEARKLDYSLAFRRRFRSGFESIENSHKQQVERLKSIQSEELAALDDLICSKSLKELNEKEAAEASMKRARDLEQERLAKERMKEKKQVQQRLQDLQQELQQRKQYQQEQQQQQQQQPQQQPLRVRPKKRKRLNKNTRPNSPPPIASPAQLNGPNQTESSRKNQKLKLGNVINAPHRGPPAVVSSAPNVQTSSQRVSTMAVSAVPSKNKKTKTAQSNAPMFHSGKMKKSAEPIVLTDTGAFTVKSKPNRVVIRSRNLGDPKDYDDAINNYKRTTPNPVTRRFYQGKPHLFYKNPDGVIVNVGPVALIKPLVTSFLLSS